MQAFLCEGGEASWSLRVTVRSTLNDNKDRIDMIHTESKSDPNTDPNIHQVE